MLFEKGIYKIWDDFSLKLNNDIKLTANSIFFLTGDNGAGKTSFIKKILLDTIAKTKPPVYPAYLSQEFAHQYYAIKAYNVYKNNTDSIVSDFSEAITYYLNELSEKIPEKHTLLLILDEAEIYKKLEEIILLFANRDVIFVVVTHNPNILEALKNKNIKLTKIIQNKISHNLAFKKITENLSEIEVEL